MSLVVEGIMKQSEIFRENAEQCAHLAESATNEPTYRRYKRMETSWLALADEQDWLDGEVTPIRTANGTPLNMRDATGPAVHAARVRGPMENDHARATNSGEGT
jgi:hypothetical protein